jgi:hypothetical protein
MRYSQRLLYAAMFLTLVAGVPGHSHGLLASPRVQAQDPHHAEHEFAPAATPGPRQGMTMNQSTMKMMGEMTAADAKLDALVQAMNAAKREEKTDAIAAVVTALVEERRSMHKSMATMMNTMMGR